MTLVHCDDLDRNEKRSFRLDRMEWARFED